MPRNRWLCMCAALAVLWIALIRFSAAETLGYTDCSSAADFGKAVAAANRDLSGFRMRGASEEQPCLVLCRTSGDCTDFPEDGLLEVIRGPANRFALKYSSRTQAQSAVSALRQICGVRYAELDADVHGAAEETEGLSFHSSGAARMGFGGYLPTVRAHQNSGVLVAVVDSGVSSHSLLNGRIRRGGYDYVDGDSDPTNDLNGHGTHVAGIIADCTSGTQTWIYPIRVLNSAAGGKISNVAAAVLEAAEAHCAVINLSLSSYTISEALEDAIRSAILQGCVVVAAAGNDAANVAEVTPGRMTEEGIIVVGSAEPGASGPVRSDYSNFGAAIDLYAYGSDISSCSRSGGYVSQSGTSMAAAHISGACALLRLIWPGMYPEQAASRLQLISTPGTIPVPQIGLLAPSGLGFSLQEVRMQQDDTLRLPLCAIPATAFADIAYEVTEGDAVSVSEDGAVTAEHPGSAVVTASCPVWDTQTICFTVSQGSSSGLTLSWVTDVEEEAFAGAGFCRMAFGEALRTVGSRAFADSPDLCFLALPDSDILFGERILEGSEQAVVLCRSGSAAAAYAEAQGLQFVYITD